MKKHIVLTRPYQVENGLVQVGLNNYELLIIAQLKEKIHLVPNL